MSDFQDWFHGEVLDGRLSSDDRHAAQSAWDESRSHLHSDELIKLDSVLLDFLIDMSAHCQRRGDMWIVQRSADGTFEELTPLRSCFKTPRDAIEAAIRFQRSLGRF